MAESFQFYYQKKKESACKAAHNEKLRAINTLNTVTYKKCINNIQHYKKWLCYVQIIVTILTVGSEKNTTHTLPLTRSALLLGKRSKPNLYQRKSIA